MEPPGGDDECLVYILGLILVAIAFAGVVVNG